MLLFRKSAKRNYLNLYQIILIEIFIITYSLKLLSKFFSLVHDLENFNPKISMIDCENITNIDLPHFHLPFLSKPHPCLFIILLS